MGWYGMPLRSGTQTLILCGGSGTGGAQGAKQRLVGQPEGGLAVKLNWSPTALACSVVSATTQCSMLDLDATFAQDEAFKSRAKNPRSETQITEEGGDGTGEKTIQFIITLEHSRGLYPVSFTDRPAPAENIIVENLDMLSSPKAMKAAIAIATRFLAWREYCGEAAGGCSFKATPNAIIHTDGAFDACTDLVTYHDRRWRVVTPFQLLSMKGYDTAKLQLGFVPTRTMARIASTTIDFPCLLVAVILSIPLCSRP